MSKVQDIEMSSGTNSAVNDQPVHEMMQYSVKSMGEINSLTHQQLRAIKLSSAAKKRIRYWEVRGMKFLDAKRKVIRENFLRTSGSSKMSKKCASQNVAESAQPLATVGLRTYIDIAVMDEMYPYVKLDKAALLNAKKSIVEALSKGGERVRFNRIALRNGYLIFRCADSGLAGRVTAVAPELTLSEGAAVLKAVPIRDLPVDCTLSVFVVDEFGERLPVGDVLRRLRANNRMIDTRLWTVRDTTHVERGQVFTFDVDDVSLQELRKLNMLPYYGFQRIMFNFKHSEL